MKPTEESPGRRGGPTNNTAVYAARRAVPAPIKTAVPGQRMMVTVHPVEGGRDVVPWKLPGRQRSRRLFPNSQSFRQLVSTEIRLDERVGRRVRRVETSLG